MLALIGPTFPASPHHAWRRLQPREYEQLPTPVHLADGKRSEEQHAQQLLLTEGYAPVDNIPTELLVHVFLLVRDSASTSSWISLTHVCRHWREIALGTPLLWTSIPVERGPAFLRACLARSSDVLVDVIFRHSLSNIDCLLGDLGSHAGRVRMLKVLVLSDDAAEKLLQDVVAPALRLEDLAFQRQTPSLNSTIPPLALPDRDWSNLRRLQLKGIALPKHSSPMMNLTSLVLSNVIAGARLALEEMLDKLSKCPRLEYLSIFDSCPSALKSNDVEGSARTHTIPLPTLQTLKLSMHASVASEILASISVPVHTVIDIKCVLDPRQTSHNLISAILRRQPSEFANIVQARSLYLFVASNIFRVRVSDASGAASTKLLDMDIECNPPMDMSYLLPDALRDLTHIASSSPVTDLQVFGDQRLIGQDDWRVSLAQLPALETLEVGSRGHVDSLFQALGSSDITVASPVCPLLKRVCIGGADVDEEAADTMLACLDDRAAHDMRLDVLAMKKRTERAPLNACTVQAILAMVGVFDYR